MKICIIGQGYIGLPTAALFSMHNCDVVGVDVNEDIIENLKKGIVHIEEPKIADIIKKSLKRGFYHPSLDVKEADVFIITVPTPYLKETYSCDLSYVVSACNTILPYLQKGNIVIVESTIAPMSTDDIIKPIFEENGYTIGKDLYLAHCPERVLPGKIIEELIHNDRIIGGVTPECSKKASDVYRKIVEGELIETEAKTAEMSKCMENTYRDVNIALANELTKICEKIGANGLDVIKLANKHPRVNIHSPGPGVGGHCLAIDPYFIYSKAPDEAKLIKLARDINNSMPKFVVRSVEKIIANKNSKIAILGIAYKGNTGDIRESPAIEIVSLLKEKGYNVAIHDPHVNSEELDLKSAVKDSSLILILSDHNEFKNLDYNMIKDTMEQVIVFDTKNIISYVPNYVKLINYGNISEIR